MVAVIPVLLVLVAVSFGVLSAVVAVVVLVGVVMFVLVPPLVRVPPLAGVRVMCVVMSAVVMSLVGIVAPREAVASTAELYVLGVRAVVVRGRPSRLGSPRTLR